MKGRSNHRRGIIKLIDSDMMYQGHHVIDRYTRRAIESNELRVRRATEREVFETMVAGQSLSEFPFI